MTERVNPADLMRRQGVGREMANLLGECGVESWKELQHRVPATLDAGLTTTNDEQKIPHRAPSLPQVEAVVVEARALAAG